MNSPFPRTLRRFVPACLAAGLPVLHAAAAPQTQTLRLDAGWNLVSFQVVPTNPAPAAVFGTLGAAFDRAFSFDNTTKAWTTFGGAGNTAGLADASGMGPIAQGRAYWVYVNQLVPAWSVTGTPVVPTPAVNLATGWNLVGIPVGAAQLPEKIELPAVLAAAGLDYDTVLRWEQSLYAKFTPTDADVDDFTAFDPNRGYWVNVKGASFSLQPRLLVSARPDQDREPQGNYPSYEDFQISDSKTPLGPTDQNALRFLPNEDAQPLAISNPGGGILLWQLDLSGAPWLAADSTNGVTTIENDVITLSIDRRLVVAGRQQGSIVLRTSAGDKTFKVIADVAGLGGDWRGNATFTSANGRRNPLPAVDLALSFFEDPSAPGLVRGQINSQNALLWPVDVPLVGHFGGADGQTFRLSGGYVLPPGDVNNAPFARFDGTAEDIDWNCNGKVDATNPFPFPIYRAVTLTGRLVSGRADQGYIIEGDYTEVVYGMRRDPIRLQGTFQIRRESAAAFASLQFVPNSESAAGTQPLVVRSTPSATVTPVPVGTFSSKLSVVTDLALASVSVDLDFGDAPPSGVVVTLVSPEGKKVVLHSKAAVASLRATGFPATRVPKESLDSLAATGAKTKGDWTLQIDNQSGVAGKLYGWTLRLAGQPVFSVSGKVSDVAGGTVPAQVFVDGLGIAGVVQAGADGTFRFDRMPGIPLNFTANAPGYTVADPAAPGLGRPFTVPAFAGTCASPAKTAALASFRPLPVTPVPAVAVDGFAATLGSTGNPYELKLANTAPAGTPLALQALPAMGFAPLPVTLSIGPSSSLLQPAVTWTYGDATAPETVAATSRDHLYATVKPEGYTAKVQAQQKPLKAGDPAGGTAVVLQRAVYPLPSPGNTPYAANFFLVNFTSGGSVPTGVGAQIKGTNDVTKPAALATLLTVQHPYAASFDIDLAPKGKAGAKFADDGFDPLNTVSNPANRDGNFRDEDYNYTVELGAGPGQWLLAADCGYVVPDDVFNPHPKPGQTGDCAGPRVAMLCNLGMAILPSTVAEVYPADATIFPNDPDPLGTTDAAGLATARGMVLVTGPLATFWKEGSR